MGSAAYESLPTVAARERVELILHQIDRLPTLPTVTARLLAATGASDTSARDIVDIIASDASLTASLLRLARRADLGLRSDGMTVPKAVTLLGFNAVRSMALTVQVFEALRGPEGAALSAHRQGLWTHNLAVACLTEMLAERTGERGLSSEAFVCGLLHDVGKIALDSCLPKSYARVVERVVQNQQCVCDAERDVLGLDHTVAGKRLAVRWKLAPAVIDCVWLHHQAPDALPSTTANPKLVRLVHLADSLARRHDIGFSGYGSTADIEEIAADLGLTSDIVDSLMKSLPERMKPFTELLGVDGSRDESLSVESLMAANRQLSALNARLSEANRKLAGSARCLASVRRLLDEPSEWFGLGDGCRAALAAVKGWTGAARVVAFAEDSGGTVIHAAFSIDDGADERCDVIDLAASQELSRAVGAARAALPGAIVVAPSEFEALWRMSGASDAGSLWLFPLAAWDGAVAGVLFEADPEAAASLASSIDESASLSTTLGLAVSLARARTRLDRDTEELLELNRRLKAAQREALRARSITMIAKMAGGAAHELNNPLSVISGRAQLARSICKDADTQRALEIIVEQANRASGIVSDLMRFAKPEPPIPRLARLADLLDPVCQHCREAHRLRTEQLRLQLAALDVEAFVDTDHFAEVVLALLTNAVEASGAEGAVIEINSASRRSDETVRFAVRDHGPGMTRDVLEHALDPFYSDRPAGRGRGLGLSRAYRLVEINGGRLWLDSTPQVGTTVTVELPSRSPAGA